MVPKVAAPLIEYLTAVELDTGALVVTVKVAVLLLRMLVGEAIRVTAGFEEGVDVGVAVGVAVGVGVAVAVGVGVGVPDAENAW